MSPQLRARFVDAFSSNLARLEVGAVGLDEAR